MKRTSDITDFKSDMLIVPQATLESKPESPQKPMPVPDLSMVQAPTPAPRKCKRLRQDPAHKLSTVKVAQTWEIRIPLEEMEPRLPNITMKKEKELISKVEPVESSYSYLSSSHVSKCKKRRSHFKNGRASEKGRSSGCPPSTLGNCSETPPVS